MPIFSSFTSLAQKNSAVARPAPKSLSIALSSTLPSSETNIDLNKVPKYEEVMQNIPQFESNSIHALLNRYAGQDVLPHGWTKGPKDKKVQVSYGRIAQTEWYAMKATGVVKLNSKQLAEMLVDEKYVPVFDEMIHEVKIIHEVNPQSTIRWVTCNSVMFTTPRDLCIMTSIYEMEDGRIIITTRSIQHQEAPKREAFVRATSMISGYILQPINENECELTLLAHMDLGGYLPSYVTNHLGLSSPINLIKKIRTVATTLSV